MDRERVIVWHLELQSAHHAIEGAFNAARTGILKETPPTTLAQDLTLHCLGFCSALDDHHRSEDTALFPRLLANDPDLADTITDLADTITDLMTDHRALAVLLAELEQSLHGGCAPTATELDRLDTQFDRIEAAMKGHFSDEEQLLHTVLGTLEAHPRERTTLLGSPPERIATI